MAVSTRRSPRTKIGGKRAAAAERRLKALALRQAFHSYREIGHKLGISHTQARKDVDRSLRDLAEKEIDEARKLRTLELERLDRLARAVWPAATRKKPDPKMVERAQRLVQQRCRLLGLDAPTKIQADLEPTLLQSLIREISAKKDAAEEGETPSPTE